MAPYPMDKYRDAASEASVARTVGQDEIANLQTASKQVTGPDPNELSRNFGELRIWFGAFSLTTQKVMPIMLF